MGNKFYGRRFKPRKNKPDEPFQRVEVYIPNSLYLMLKDKSRELGLPVSRLCAVAIDNEFDQSVPFNYPCEMPKSEYEEYRYASTAGKILAFLAKIPKGTGVDMLMLSRRDIGVENREQFMNGFRELIETEMIEAIEPIGTRFEFYNSDYKYYRAVDAARGESDRAKRRKFKRVEEETTKGVHRIKDSDVER